MAPKPGQLKNESTQVETPVVEPNKNIVNEYNESNELSFSEKVKNAVTKKGFIKINNLKIKKLTWSDKDTYKLLCITTVGKVNGMVKDEDTDEWEQAKTNTIFTAMFAFVASMAESDEVGHITVDINKSPDMLSTIFQGATIDIIQKYVEAGEEYINPFSTTDKVYIPENNMYMSSVVKIKLSERGKAAVNKLDTLRLVDKDTLKSMLGF